MVKISGVQCRVARDEIREDVSDYGIYPQDMCIDEVEKDQAWMRHHQLFPSIRDLFRDGLRLRGTFYSNLDSILANDAVKYISCDEAFDEYENMLDLRADADKIVLEKEIAQYENRFEPNYGDVQENSYLENLEEKSVRLTKRLNDFYSKNLIQVRDSHQLHKALVAVRKGEIKPHRFELSYKLKKELTPWYSRNSANKNGGVHNVASCDIGDYAHLEADLAQEVYGHLNNSTQVKDEVNKRDILGYVNRPKRLNKVYTTDFVDRKVGGSSCGFGSNKDPIMAVLKFVDMQHSIYGRGIINNPLRKGRK